MFCGRTVQARVGVSTDLRWSCGHTLGSHTVLSQPLKFSAAVPNPTDRCHRDWTHVRGVSESPAAPDAYTAPGRSLSWAS